MKICVVSARFYPQLVGSGTSAYVIASELSKRGHDVVVLTDASLRGESSHFSLPFRIEYIESLEDFAMGDAGFRDALGDLYEHIGNYKPDVIQVCNFMPMLLISIIRPKLNCPVVFTFFNTPVIGKRATGYFADATLDTELGSFILRTNAYDRIVLGSRHYVDAALSLGASPDKIQVSYLAPDVDSFFQGSRDVDLKAVIKSYFPDREVLAPYLLLPSRITAQKGVIEAIEALAIINNKSEVRYSLLLTGMADPFDKDYAREVWSRVDVLGLRRDILVPHRTIDRANLAMFFKGARLVIVPSWYEGLGLAAIEAQYLGVPLAVSDTTGLNEVVEDGVTGVLFKPRNSQSMADAALGVLSGSIDTGPLVENAKNSVAKFSLDRHISELEEIYKDATGGYM